MSCLQIVRLTHNMRTNSLCKFIGQQLVLRRSHGTSSDYANRWAGKREYVGFGVNGSPNYADMYDYPLPALRFREPDEKTCALREKEKDDWKKLSKDEIKTLYRYSFCQTLSELKANTGEWKFHVGVALWTCAVGILYTCLWNAYHTTLPPTFAEDRRQAQLKRMIGLEINPVVGMCSKWDYEVGDWK